MMMMMLKERKTVTVKTIMDVQFVSTARSAPASNSNGMTSRIPF
jgi:hypothetical protein